MGWDILDRVSHPFYQKVEKRSQFVQISLVIEAQKAEPEEIYVEFKDIKDTERN